MTWRVKWCYVSEIEILPIRQPHKCQSRVLDREQVMVEVGDFSLPIDKDSH